MPRLFLALDVPEDVREALRSAFSIPPGMRATKVENYHLTLAFLGEAHSGDVIDALDSLSPSSEIPLVASGWGGFPSMRSARVLWAGVDGGDALHGLAKRVKEACRPVAPEMDAKKMHPHLTIARSKEGVDLSGFDAAYEPLVWTAHEFALFQTSFRSGGAEYSRLGSWRT